MADVVPLAATIALSPAPMTAPRRMPSNLLVFSSQYDLGILQRQAAALAAAAGGERIAPQDFAEQRAFSLQFLPHATHTTTLIDREWHIGRRNGQCRLSSRRLTPGQLS